MGYWINWNYTKIYRSGDDYESDDLRLTYNLHRMMNWAFDSVQWTQELEGKSGKELQPVVENALHRMLSGKEEAEQYNSPNGFGNYDDAVKFLKELVAECKRYPDLYCEIS